MSEKKKVLKFPIEDSDHLIRVVEELPNIKIDMDVDSTPSSITISLYGSKGKVEEASGKVQKLMEDTKSS